MALETLTHNISTLSSDRWSFGVLVWEIYTFGERPYAGLQNKEVLGHVRAGRRLRHPAGCPGEMYHIMERCWSATPELRPAFNGNPSTAGGGGTAVHGVKVLAGE